MRHSLTRLSRGDIPIRPPVRILIADDHAVVRFGLKTILSREEGWQVVGEATSGAEALALALQLQPDVAVLDINMPGMSGLDALKAIRERLPATRVVILTLHYSHGMDAGDSPRWRQGLCDEVGRRSRFGGRSRGRRGGKNLLYAESLSRRVPRSRR